MVCALKIRMPNDYPSEIIEIHYLFYAPPCFWSFTQNNKTMKNINKSLVKIASASFVIILLSFFGKPTKAKASNSVATPIVIVVK